MKKYLSIALLAISAISASALDTKDIYIRDPYIYPNKANNTYYLYKSQMAENPDGSRTGGVICYKSKDLKTWSDPVRVLTVPADNWATGTIWAPEMHEIDGKFYMFATVNDTITWKRVGDNAKPLDMRGTQIFVADTPEGPFVDCSDRMPVTPMGFMALDGTFYRENGRNYMVYCHEWLELGDGTVELVELDGNFRRISEPTRLFAGSAAPWSTGMNNKKDFVTDGVFLYKSPTSGNLYMIWSSFMNGEYALGVARSKTGRITGPWIQIPQPLFSKDGGHGMIFTDFDDKLRVALHGPNHPGGAERLLLFEVYDDGNTLQLK